MTSACSASCTKLCDGSTKELSLGTGNWTDYVTDNSWGPAGYAIDAQGFCHIRGLVKNGTGVVYPSTNIAIADGLPVPKINVMGLGLFNDSAGHTGVARIDIQNGVGGTTAGRLTMAGSDFALNGGNNGVYSLLALSFPPYSTLS